MRVSNSKSVKKTFLECVAMENQIYQDTNKTIHINVLNMVNSDILKDTNWYMDVSLFSLFFESKKGREDSNLQPLESW